MFRTFVSSRMYSRKYNLGKFLRMYSRKSQTESRKNQRKKICESAMTEVAGRCGKDVIGTTRPADRRNNAHLTSAEIALQEPRQLLLDLVLLQSVSLQTPPPQGLREPVAFAVAVVATDAVRIRRR